MSGSSEEELLKSEIADYLENHTISELLEIIGKIIERMQNEWD